MAKLQVVSLFSGCGGLDLGFQNQGFDLLYACDNDTAAVSCYNRNIGSHAVVRDVSSNAFHEDMRSLGYADLVLGGFPCQGFSKAGPKKADDERNQLYREMRNAVRLLRPRMFIAENVDGISQNFGGAYITSITDDFSKLGYTVEYRILNAAAFGVPQHRRRVFFVGLANRENGTFNWPTPTHNITARNGESRLHESLPLWDTTPMRPETPSPKSIADAIEGLQDLDESIPDHRISLSWPKKYRLIFEAIGPGQKLCNVRHARTSVYTWDIPEVFGDVNDRERLILETIAKNRRHKRYGNIPNGNPISAKEIARLAGLRGVKTAVASLLEQGYLKEKDGGYDLKGAMFCSGLFKRPVWDQPAPTVLTNFHNPRYFLHPSEDRPFSLRECARLQGFPDSFIISEGSSEVDLVAGYRLVGNAVPPPLSQVLAESVAQSLHASRVVSYAS